jgi:glycosyltransferase involved in cell wall biosynthesis
LLRRESLVSGSPLHSGGSRLLETERGTPPTGVSMKTRIVISASSYLPQENGMSTVAQMLSLTLAECGYDVTLATPSVSGQERIGYYGPVKVTRVDAAGRGTLVSRYAGDIAGYRRLLRESAADIYLFLGWETWMVYAAAPMFNELRGKKVLASHGTSALWRPPGVKGWARRILWLPHLWRYRRFLPIFDFFVLLTPCREKSRFYDKVLLEKRGQNNWAVIPNGCDRDASSGLGDRFRRQYQLESHFVILYVANYHWSKNQEGLIRVFHRAQVKNTTLVLIGPEMNDYGRRLQQRHNRESEASKRILFLTGQSQQDLRDAYCGADLFASTSLTEAQPLVILDAMASATPFLSFAVGSVPELPGGVVVNTEREMAQQIQLLAEDEETRKRLGIAGRKACLEVYNWERTGMEYDRLFQRMLKETHDSALAII